MDIGQSPKIIANRFLIKGKLGQGGMGQVFHVYDYLTYEDVALKSVLFDRLSDPLRNTTQSNYNFAREFQILASLRHPHIVQVFTYGFDAERKPYYVMQMLKSPQNFLQATRSLPLKEKLSLTVQMLRALLYLHHRGIIHRDIKPGNVLLSEGKLRVLDFGLATKQDPAAGEERDSDMIEGTLAYMAPELFSGAGFSVASDLYAVGIMLYEAIAGQHPFAQHGIMNLVTAILTEKPNLDVIRTGWQSSVGEGMDHDVTRDLGRPDSSSAAVGQNDITKDLGLSVSSHEAETRQVQINAEAGAELELDSDDVQTKTDFRIVAIISKLLAKDPQKRYQDAADVIRDLSTAIGEEFPIETSATRESFLQASDFIGREDEFTRLTQALSAAQEGKGSLVVISGERGIGKTRLIQELHTHALVEGNIVTIGSATAEKAYDIWKDPLQRLSLETKLEANESVILREVYSNLSRTRSTDSNILTDPEPQDRQKRLFNTISSLLSRQREPVVIILEDIHLAGSESLAILRHISQTISSLRLLIVATFSSDEGLALKDHLAGINFVQVDLARFASEHIASLSESMLGKVGTEAHIVDYLVEQTEGNVLFMIEIIRALAEEVGQLEKIATIQNLPTQITTGGILQLLQKRLQRMPDPTLPPLHLAAVVGKRMNTKIIATIFPELAVEEWLNVGASANVLEFSQGVWQFTHHKLRDVVQSNIAPDDLKELNVKAAQAFIECYSDDPAYAANIASHWRSANQPQKELEYTFTASDYAYRISAFEESLSHYRRVLELLPSEDVENRINVRNRIATIHIMQDQLTSAFEIATESLNELEDNKNPVLLAEVQKVLGRIDMTRGNFKDAAQRFTQALSLYQSQDHRTGIADVLINEGRLFARMGRFDEAMENAAKALALLQQANNQWETASTLNLLSSLYGQTGRFSEATEYALQALQTMQELGNREGMAGIQSNLGIINLMQRNTSEAKNWLQKAQVIYEEIRQFRGLASCLNNLGMIAMNDGDADTAKASFDQALSYISEIEDPHFTSNIRVNMARAHFLLEDYTTAMNEFKKVLVTGQKINAMPLVTEALIGVAHLLYQVGDVETVMRIRRGVSALASQSREVEEQLNGLDKAIEGDERVHALPDAALEESIEVLIQHVTTLPFRS